MKSSGVGGNDERRIRILNDLHSLPASYYLFVVDKRRISKDFGLIFKRPFIKFLAGKVYNRLFRTFPNLDVVSDNHGSDEFIQSLISYVRSNHQPTLFERSTFACAESRSEPLVQVADIIAGSVARLFDETRKSAVPEAILRALKGKIVCLEEWPPVYHALTASISTAVATDHDSMVSEYCKNQVTLYLEALNDESDEDRLREAALTYLADQSRYRETDRYVSGAEIVSHLESIGFTDQSLHMLRSNVINHFRDNGVIIASNNTGYKIPTKVSDIANYVDRCDAVIEPMVSRLRSAREQILMMSHNTLDILGSDRLLFLKGVVDRAPLSQS